MDKFSILPQICAAMSASLILLCSGFHFGWITVAVPHLQADFGAWVTAGQIRWIVALLSIGSICGTLLGLVLVDIRGRKSTLLITTVPFVFSCLLIIFARSYWWIYLARFLAGIGVGVATTVTPMYIGEIADSRIRGSLCTLMPVMLNIGQLVPLIIGYWVSGVVLGIVGAIIPIVFATSLIWVPESPYYFSMKRNPYEMQKSIAWLKGTSDVAQEVEQIDNSITLDRRSGVNFLNLFTVLRNRKALLVISVLSIAQSLSGWMWISFHSIRSFYMSGMEISPIYISIIMGSIQLVTSFCVVFLIDKVGRRPLLLTSVSVCLVFLLVQALYDNLTDAESSTPSIPWLPVVASIGYAISYSMGLGTLPMVIAAEIFPCEVKAFALALFTAFQFAIGTGISMFCSFFLIKLSFYVGFYIFAFYSLVCAIFVYFIIPETKGCPLAKIKYSF